MYENPFYNPYWVSEEELEHFGVKGMKWGVRRYQNADGTLTEAGKKKLEKYRTKEQAKVIKRYERTKSGDLKYARRAKDQELADKLREHRIKTHKADFDAEMNALKKMKYKDMQNEKAAIGKQWIKSAALTIGTHMLPLPIAVVSWPNYANIKANYRAGDKMKGETQLAIELAQIKKTEKQKKKNQEIAKYLSK